MVAICHKHNPPLEFGIGACPKCCENTLEKIVQEGFDKLGICSQCNKDKKKCKCDHVTVRSPDYRSAASMSYESIGDGCYCKKKAVIE